MEQERIKFYVEKNGFWTHYATVLLVLAAVFQFLACWGLWNDRTVLLTQMLLPCASYLLFALLLTFFGQAALWTTALPYLAGIAFCGGQVWFTEDRLLLILTLVYCVVATVLYLCTVFCLIHTKWLLVPLFGLPFLYRAFYRDVLLLQHNGESVSFAAGMREMSLLLVLLALTFTALGMKKLVKERRLKTSAYDLAGKPPAPEPVTPLSQKLEEHHEPTLTLENTPAEATETGDEGKTEEQE